MSVGTDGTDGTDVDTSRRITRGRRPVAVARQAILDAAASLLFDEGLSAVTFEKVAQRAGASKMTLYKWWPTPGALALDAYFAAVEPTLAFPDTGDIEVDLRTQLHAFVDLMIHKRGGPVIAELIGEAQSDTELAKAFSASYTHPRRKLAVDTLVTAQRRGQIRPDVDPEVVVDQLWGACYHRLLLPDQPLTLAFADALIHNLMFGIGAR
jgi:AcrR family transcriptional regulator